jgi:hypothetical protein
MVPRERPARLDRQADQDGEMLAGAESDGIAAQRGETGRPERAQTEGGRHSDQSGR